ncbi:MAG: tripartite tricarboxylate transporter TctB family protein [Pseudomonadota bacterium]|nr:tripartite tricarboxylate transporter TctB family protein [Pseudomonadota bacterium]
MGRLQRRHIIEAALWLIFAALAYYFSFRFEKSIEIYKFGASGWPRAVILVIVISALAQLATQYFIGDDGNEEVIGSHRSSEEEQEPHDRAYFLRMAGILLLPVIYAYTMDWVGFYISTPFFAAAVIYLMGERRWKWIVGISLLVWALLVFVFTVLLYTGLPTGNTRPFYDFSNWLLVLLR